MKTARPALICLALAACFQLPALAAQTQSQTGPTPTIASLSVLVDPAKSMTIDDVTGEKSGEFKESPLQFRSNILNDAAYWLRITIRFPTQSRGESWVLDLSWDILRSLDCYFPFPGGAKTVLNGDSNLYIDSVINLPLPQTGDELVLFARLTGYFGINLNPVIKSTAANAREDETHKWLLGIFFGLLGSMFVYNLFLSLSLRDSSYLWYIAHIFLIGVYFVIVNGLIFFQQSAGSQDAFTLRFNFFLAVCGLMFLCMGMFSRSFLLTREKHPVLDGFLLAQLGSCAAFLLILAFIGPMWAKSFIPLVATITSVTVVIVGTGRVIQGFKPARIFLAGWAFYVTCGFIHSMTMTGIFSPTLFAMYAPEFGSTVEVMVMSLALAYRVKILKDEKELAERDRELLAQENTLQSLILENSRLGIGLVQEGRLTRSNRQLRLMAGRVDDPEAVRLDELPGFAGLLDLQDRVGGAGLLEKEGVVGAPSDRKIVRALGKMVDPRARRAGVVWVVEDVTKQKGLEQLKDDIEHIFRHDLKSPLTAIGMLQKAIARSGPLSEDQTKYCRMIGESVDWGLAQLNTALAIYKIESGAPAAAFHPVDLAEAVCRAISDLTPYTGGGEKVVKQTPAEGGQPGEAFICGDETMVHAILVNLIKNALEALPGPGETTVSISLDGQVRVDIANPGEVPAEVRDRFFEKYATAGKDAGTGLGTYSARLMARAMGGDVELDCSRPGQTTVSVRFVRADSA